MTGIEYRALLGVVAGIATVGAAAAVAGIADHVAAAALVAAGLCWIAAAGLRRERRIRARLADPRTPPDLAPRGEVPHTRVGPGDHAQVPPAPTRRLDPADPSDLDRVPDRGRIDRTGGAT